MYVIKVFVLFFVGKEIDYYLGLVNLVLEEELVFKCDDNEGCKVDDVFGYECFFDIMYLCFSFDKIFFVWLVIFCCCVGLSFKNLNDVWLYDIVISV